MSTADNPQVMAGKEHFDTIEQEILRFQTIQFMIS
jgi:hypothetical protein